MLFKKSKVNLVTDRYTWKWKNISSKLRKRVIGETSPNREAMGTIMAAVNQYRVTGGMEWYQAEKSLVDIVQNGDSSL